MKNLSRHAAALLSILLILSISASFTMAESYLLYEDFGGPTPPGWSAVDGGNDGNTWMYANPFYFSPATPAGFFTGPSAVVDAYNRTAATEQLITPSINASALSGSIYLEFKHYFRYSPTAPNQTADVDISANNGVTWTNLLRLNSATVGPESRTIDITAPASGQANVKVRFHIYNATGGFWWMIDDVKIYSTSGATTVNLLYEDFNTFPDNWSVISQSTPLSFPWAVNSSKFFNLLSPFTNNCIVIDSNAAGATTLDEQLITSSFNAKNVVGQIYLEFANQFSYYVYSLDEIGDVDVSADHGAWTNVLRMTGQNYGPETKSINITSLARGHESVTVRFRYYNSRDDHYWIVDDVRVRSTQSRPSANAGNDRSVHQGEIVALDGSASYDPDGDLITYLWSIQSRPAGSAAMLADSTAVQPYFVVDKPGNYIISLVVTDSNGNSSVADEVIISTVNSPPVADAGEDQSIHVGILATLSGGGSDPEGDPVTFSWQFTQAPPGSQAVLNHPSSAAPSFIPDLMGSYTLKLIVTDAWGLASAPDYVTVSTKNTKPVAAAGGDIPVIRIGELVALDGRQSYDVDGDPLTYQWTLRSLPGGSAAVLSEPTTETPYFIPDLYGDYIIELIVSDPWTTSDPDSVTVSFTNVKPVADAGDTQSVDVGDVVLLDGSRSSDGNGDPLTFVWTLSPPPDSHAFLDDNTLATPSFTADVPGTYTASLVVSDGYSNSVASSVAVHAKQSASNLVTILQDALAAVNNVEIGCYKNKNMQKTLAKKLTVVLENAEEGLFAEAYNKLQHDILGKLDGCGAAADKNDWVICCAGQHSIRPLIEEAMYLLAGNL